MRHVVVEKWSRGDSGLHRCDPRAKLLVLAIFLITIATASRAVPMLALVLLAILLAGLLWAKLPVTSVLLRAAIVFSFTIPFALLTLLTGDESRAEALVCKSYLSSLAVLVVVSTTPISTLLRGLAAVGAPRFLLLVSQVLYRYLFVITGEAQQMRTAAVARGGAEGGAITRSVRFQAAAGALGALFARSYTRAEDIHRAMLSRGFTGHFPTLQDLHFRASDAIFSVTAGLLPLLARVAVERFA